MSGAGNGGKGGGRAGYGGKGGGRGGYGGKGGGRGGYGGKGGGRGDYGGKGGGRGEWEDYASGSDSEDVRLEEEVRTVSLSGLRSYETIRVRTGEQEAVHVRDELLRQAGVPKFEAFRGKAFKLRDEPTGTTRNLWVMFGVRSVLIEYRFREVFK
jgi:hypothetical protein